MGATAGRASSGKRRSAFPASTRLCLRPSMRARSAVRDPFLAAAAPPPARPAASEASKHTCLHRGSQNTSTENRIVRANHLRNGISSGGGADGNNTHSNSLFQCLL